MSLNEKFKKADEIVNNISREDRRTFQEICREIQAAQNTLSKRSRMVMQRCFVKCKGICCRNIYANSIINLFDCVFILHASGLKRSAIDDCLAKEEMDFAANCLFLEDNVGPCLLPSTTRPLLCAITFCGNEKRVKKEIGLVQSKFSKLFWFLCLRKYSFLKKLFFGKNSTRSIVGNRKQIS